MVIICSLLCGFQPSDLKQLHSPQHVLTIFVFKLWVSDSPTSHNGLLGRAGAKLKASSPDALPFITYLCCTVLGKNKAVHVSHSHHIKNRAPGVAQCASDQCSEIESQEVQVILRRRSVSLKRHGKLQENHPKATLLCVSGSK